jgi:hypothetical protein
MTRKMRRPGLKTRKHHTYRNRQRGGELTVLNKFKFIEDKFNEIKQQFLDLVVIDVKYLNKDIFFDDIKTNIKSICSDEMFLTHIDSIMNPTKNNNNINNNSIRSNNNNSNNNNSIRSNNSNINIDMDEVREYILGVKGFIILEITHIVLLDDTTNSERLDEIDSDVGEIVVNYLLSLPEINRRRAQQRQNVFMGLQGQRGLPSNIAREVTTYL